MAMAINEHAQISSASITINPLAAPQDSDFNISAAELVAGQRNFNGISRAEALKIIDRAIAGEIEIEGRCLTLEKGHRLDFYSEMGTRDRWYADLHLRIAGQQPRSPNNIDFSLIDTLLRGAEMPFDGLADVSLWLALPRPDEFNRAPAIEIRVGPPADLQLEQCTLASDVCKVVLHARPEFDPRKAKVGIASFPGVGLKSRRSISSEIGWMPLDADRQIGIAQVKLQHADSALVMLTIGSMTVRRQWFSDPNKARNIRLVAVQQFDRELRMLRAAVLEPQDPTRFETGIAALLFLLGFSSAVQIETDSPDLVVTTTSGRLILVECTLRTADINTKIGKLVDRCNALRRTLESNSHRSAVYGVLICAGPRDQIAIRDPELVAHGIHLIAKEELVSAFDRLRFPNDPDKMMDHLDEKSLRTTFP